MGMPISQYAPIAMKQAALCRPRALIGPCKKICMPSKMINIANIVIVGTVSALTSSSEVKMAIICVLVVCKHKLIRSIVTTALTKVILKKR